MASVKDGKLNFYLLCKSCGKATEKFLTQQKAMSAWNDGKTEVRPEEMVGCDQCKFQGTPECLLHASLCPKVV
jgi:hypothetical protein